VRHIVVGTAGHIDHGKSALVMALTGTDPDRLKEEKERGITIDLGFAHWRTGDLTVAFVDVPGHERFVKNMLAGIGGIDAVVLVVAADESVMPQTREHFEICRLLHVPAGIIALTKTDLVDLDTLELVKLEVRDLVRGSFLETAPIVAVSSRTGVGLDALRGAIEALGGQVRGRSSEGVVRLPIDRAFSVKGFGTVVTGTLGSGSLLIDDELAVLPRGARTKVRGIQVHGARVDTAVAGQRAAVNLGGLDLADLARGDTLASEGTLATTRIVDVRLEVVASGKPIRHGARVRFHQGTSERLGRVAISSVGGPHAVDVPSTVEVGPGCWAYARIRLESEGVLTRGDRFILRAYSPPLTVAGGIVLDPLPPRTGIRTSVGHTRFRRLDPGAEGLGGPDRDESALRVMLDESGLAGLPLGQLVSRGGLSPIRAESLIMSLSRTHQAARIGDVLVAREAVQGLGTAIVEALGDYHRMQPLSDGMPREEVRERLCGRAAAGVFEHVLSILVEQKTLIARERLALAGHQVALSGEDARVRDQAARAFLDGGFAPPDAGEVAAALGVGREVVDRIAALLVRQRLLIKIDALLFHADTIQRLKREVAEMKQAAGADALRLDVAAFKARYGITRKFAIPLLEYLDRERVTRRVGEARIVL
jgi:selenocysteine-specific elongation factor